MNKFMLALTLTTLMLAAQAAEHAQPAASAASGTAKSEAMHPQQDKMKACNKSASGMKGDERKTFMKECLSKKKA